VRVYKRSGAAVGAVAGAPEKNVLNSEAKTSVLFKLIFFRPNFGPDKPRTGRSLCIQLFPIEFYLPRYPRSVTDIANGSTEVRGEWLLKRGDGRRSNFQENGSASKKNEFSKRQLPIRRDRLFLYMVVRICLSALFPLFLLHYNNKYKMCDLLAYPDHVPINIS
jgi:hypothetical protein